MNNLYASTLPMASNLLVTSDSLQPKSDGETAITPKNHPPPPVEAFLACQLCPFGVLFWWNSRNVEVRTPAFERKEDFQGALAFALLTLPVWTYYMDAYRRMA